MMNTTKVFDMISLSFMLFLLSSCGVIRSLVFMAPNADDYRHDPQVVIQPDGAPFRFTNAAGSGNMGEVIWVSGGPDEKKIPLGDFAQEYGTSAFIIIRNDSILFESFKSGTTSIPPASSFSISKAIVTTLVGIAIKEEAICSLDQPVCEILPDWSTRGFDDLRIIDLMQHTSGMSFSKSIRNPWSDQVQFYYGRNLKKRMQRRKPDAPPGEDYDYHSANTVLLTMVLEKATGLSISDYLESRLWQPLNMEHPASWSLDRQGRKSVVRSFCCLQAQGLDFAKLGRLWLNNGVWEEKEILPPNWMNELLYKRKNKHSRYRCGFRLFHGDPQIYYTSGLLGQYIYIVPNKNVIILRFGEHRERYSGRFWQKIFSEIIDHV